MSFEYHEPTSLAEAVEQGAAFGADGRFLAGGTDLIIQMRRGALQPRHIVSLHRVPGLDAIDVNGAVTLGALVTHRALERHAAFQGRLRALVEGAEVVGGHQVRNVATVGGNIVNGSPAADVVPVLLALDATVTCVGPEGERTLALDYLSRRTGQDRSASGRAPHDHPLPGSARAVRHGVPEGRPAQGHGDLGRLRGRAAHLGRERRALRGGADRSRRRRADDVARAGGGAGPRGPRADARRAAGSGATGRGRVPADQ